MENEKEKPQEQGESNDFGGDEVSKPTVNKVVSVGCEDGHNLVKDWYDSGESRWHYQCSRCWQGSYGPKEK